MGRFDALIALISGSTLVGFVGLVVYAVLAAFGVFNGGTVSGAEVGGYGAGLVTPDNYAPDGVSSPVPQFERQPATLEGEAVSYLDFGANTPLANDGMVAIAPIWVFIDGFDEAGAPRMIPDHPSVLDVNIGDPGYSDLWDVQFVLVPDGYDSRAIQSLEDLRASGLEVIPAGMLVNCPLVEEDATTSEGHTTRSGWVRGELVHYFDLGISGVRPGAIYEFVLSDDPALGGYATPEPLSVPPLVVPPDLSGEPTQFFRLYQVEVRDEKEAEAIRSAAELDAGGFWIRATGELVNRLLITD